MERAAARNEVWGARRSGGGAGGSGRGDQPRGVHPHPSTSCGAASAAITGKPPLGTTSAADMKAIAAAEAGMARRSPGAVATAAAAGAEASGG